MKTLKVQPGTKISIQLPGGWVQTFSVKTGGVLTFAADGEKVQGKKPVTKKKTAAKKTNRGGLIFGLAIGAVILLFMYLN